MSAGEIIPRSAVSGAEPLPGNRASVSRPATRSGQIHGMVAALQGIVTPAVPEWLRRGLPEEPLRLAAMRILLRLVVIRRAEAAGLLPGDDPLYRTSYSLSGLYRRLAAGRLTEGARLAGRGYAWARLQSLFHLVWGGSVHPALPVRAYGGELFEPGTDSGDDLVLVALAVLREHGPDDASVLAVLERLADCEHMAGGADVPAARLIGTLYEELLEWQLDLAPGLPTPVSDRSRRKGTGSFYTPPELARDLVKNTLSPLLTDARGCLHPPEILLSLKVCDPAMGSGSFLSAALDVLSDALARSLHEHGRVRPAHTGPGKSAATVADLGNGIWLELPGTAGDPLHEEALRGRVRRLVVESCLWGVDLDPVAVELSRTALWLETLDRRLPLTFLDHKLVLGDALVGCRLSDLPVYPLSAWRLEPSAPRINAEARMVLLDHTSPPLPLPGTERPETVCRRLSTCLGELKAIPIEFPDRKRQSYRTRVLSDGQALALKGQMDRWCALWFTKGPPGPARPGPRTWHRDPAAGLAAAAQMAGRLRFLHWELTFPDVFEGEAPGFDALIGNPPWEVLRSRPDQAMLSRWFSGRACPGGPLDARFRALGAAGEDPSGAAIAAPFLHQGQGDHNTYRLFLEQAWHLTRRGGRLGFLVPGGIASDRGAAPLRRLFLDEGSWERLTSFDNRKRLFPVDSRLKFCAVVVRKGGSTKQVCASFGNEGAIPSPGTPWSRELLERHSVDLAFPELADAGEMALFSKLHEDTVPLARWCPSSSPPAYSRELDAGNAGGRFGSLAQWISRGAEAVGIDPGTEREPNAVRLRSADPHQASNGNAAAENTLVPGLWGHEGRLLLPVVHGALVQSYAILGCSGGEEFLPRDLVPAAEVRKGRPRGLKVAVRRVTNATNTRTLIAALVPDLPCTDKAAVLMLPEVLDMLVLVALLNSFALDFVARRICAGTNLDRHHLMRLPMPGTDGRLSPRLGLAVRSLRLGACHPLFAPLWLHCLERIPELAERPWRGWWAVTPAARTALKVEADLLAAAAYGLTPQDLDLLLSDCRHPAERLSVPATAATLPRRGFWRVDRDRPPDVRHTELVRTFARSGLPTRGWEDSLTAHLGPLLAPWQEGLDATDDWESCRRIARRLHELGFRVLPERRGLL